MRAVLVVGMLAALTSGAHAQAPGVGGRSIRDDEAGRGSFRIGAGVERRFTAWALHAELRLVGISENDDSSRPTSRRTTRWQKLN